MSATERLAAVPNDGVLVPVTDLRPGDVLTRGPLTVSHVRQTKDGVRVNFHGGYYGTVYDTTAHIRIQTREA